MNGKQVFLDRRDAGRRLGEQLGWLRGQDVVVLALPRGGVPVALEVAAVLGAPLDVLGVRKVGLPGRPELAMGAVGEGGVEVVLEEVVRVAGVGRLQLAQAQAHARAELEDQLAGYRGVAPHLPVAGRVALIVDDGAVTGATLRAACRVARARHAERVVVAVPVAAPEVLEVLEGEADVVRGLLAPSGLAVVEDCYGDASPVTDEQVRALLADRSGLRLQVIDLTAVDGVLTVPDDARGLVVVAGEGLATTAAALRAEGWGTLVIDDLGGPLNEAVDRLLAATRAALTRPACAGLPVGWLGADLTVPVLLAAASEQGAPVDLLVCRGGRPDLARPVLPQVVAPTLLIVGARDRRGVTLARQAMVWLRCESELRVVPGATASFAEPGSHGAAVALTERWLTAHLTREEAVRH